MKNHVFIKQGQINFVVVVVFDLQNQFESITNSGIGGEKTQVTNLGKSSQSSDGFVLDPIYIFNLKKANKLHTQNILDNNGREVKLTRLLITYSIPLSTFLMSTNIGYQCK